MVLGIPVVFHVGDVRELIRVGVEGRHRGVLLPDSRGVLSANVRNKIGFRHGTTGGGRLVLGRHRPGRRR